MMCEVSSCCCGYSSCMNIRVRSEQCSRSRSHPFFSALSWHSISTPTFIGNGLGDDKPAPVPAGEEVVEGKIIKINVTTQIKIKVTKGWTTYGEPLMDDALEDRGRGLNAEGLNPLRLLCCNVDDSFFLKAS